MIRERIGRAALRAYPLVVRQTRGLEMLGMLLDAGEQSRWALVRESGSLVLGGLRERGAITARAGTRRLIADACCQAVLIFMVLWLISALNTQGSWQGLLAQEVMLAAILACALIGYERIAAGSGLVAIVVMAASGPVGQHTHPVLLAMVLFPITCLSVMVLAPQRRPRDRRQLLWLLPVSALVGLTAYAHVSLQEDLAVVSVVALLRLFHDPRLAVACSLVWISVLAHAGGRAPPGLGLPAILAATAVGLMLTFAAQRLWIMGHSAAA